MHGFQVRTPICHIVLISRIFRGVVWGGGGGKTGSICHFAFSLILQCLEVARYPDAGKHSTKKASWSRAFMCGPNASRSYNLRAMSPNTSRQSTGKMTNRPHFGHTRGGVSSSSESSTGALKNLPRLLKKPALPF